MLVVLVACGDDAAPGAPIAGAATVEIVDEASAGPVASGMLRVQLSGDARPAGGSCGAITVGTHCTYDDDGAVVLLQLEDPIATWDDDLALAALVATVGEILAAAQPIAIEHEGPAARALAILGAARAGSIAAIDGARATATGKLSAASACLAASSDGSVTHVACADAPAWELRADRTLRLPDARCLQTLPTEELVVGAACDPGPRTAYVLDATGHLLAGTPPIPRASSTTFSPLACLAPSAGRVRAHACPPDDPAVWDVIPTFAR